ncbi:hypothetical protein F66182_476 [Fusarium sp. NRRL 66182]|nr:hypothetical protein F66182_476 [Fusarium sp. NRRL 66182]
MEEPSKMQLSPLEQMPLDALAYLLSFLPDKPTFRAAIISCPAIYNAFKYRKVYIASSVLFQSMDEGVYKEFVVGYKMKQEKWKGAAAGVKAINRVYESDQQQHIATQFLTLPQVKAMWRLHKSVEFFADLIATSLIRDHPVVRYKSAFSITPTVRSRFQRSLYRLDTYVNLMKTMITWIGYDNGGKNRELTEAEQAEAHWIHCLKGLEEHRILKAFHSHYSAFEVEQLSNACGLLITEIAPVFNTFLEKDIEMGAQLPYYISHPQSPGSMSLVGQGLAFLYDLMKAGTRAKQSLLFKSIEKIDWAPTLPTRPPFPSEDQKLHCVLHDNEARPAHWANQPTPDFLMREPFFQDSECGPARAWEALSRFTGFLAEQDPEFIQHHCLPWAYIFWDIDMLLKAGAVKIKDGAVDYGYLIPQDHPINEVWNPFAKWDTEEAAEAIMFSFQRKNVLERMGQTGYFDFDTFRTEGATDTFMATVTPEMAQAMQNAEASQDIASFMRQFGHLFVGGRV